MVWSSRQVDDLSLSLQNSLKFSDVKHGTLSETMVCGNPKCEKSCSRMSMVLFAEIDWVGWIQGYLEKASTSTNQFEPMKLTAWSKCKRLHGFSGTIQVECRF